ncbi:MAG: hypothetical protein P9M06_05640 [Candidatus Saelkia tenebricola]|nr:hypothetical protein [Candidatus Saelkia tenebricola]
MIEEITKIIYSYPYNPYRKYRIIPKEQRQRLLSKKIEGLRNKKNVWFIEEKRKNQIIGLISLEKLNWDTKHFGIPMGSIEYLLTKMDLDYKEDLEAKDKLVKEVLRLTKKHRIKHLTCRIDCADHAAICALQQNGFYLMDTILTHIFTQKHNIPQTKDLYKVREAKKEDLPILMDIARSSFRNSRFHHEPYLSLTRSDEVYAEWIKNALYKKVAGLVLVAEKSKYPIGFFACKEDEEMFSYIGVRCLSRGLAACLQEEKGAYISLLKNAICIGKKVMEVDMGEFMTQIYNYSVIRTYQKFGMDLVKIRHVFHKIIKEI